MANSSESLEAQIREVTVFTKQNFLVLNPNKCEILCLSKAGNVSPPHCCIDGNTVPVRDEVKCLGYVWRGNLSAVQMVEYNCSKARRAFFVYGGIGGFQGDLSPLSGRSIIDTCVLPVLLYGCEQWRLTETSLGQLDSLVGELCKRVLRLPKWFCNTPARIVMGMPSMRAHCLVRKLCFLRKLTDGDAECASIDLSLGLRCWRHLGVTRSLLAWAAWCGSAWSWRNGMAWVSLRCCAARMLIVQVLGGSEMLFMVVTWRSCWMSLCEGRSDAVVVVRIEREIIWCRLWDCGRNRGPRA